MPEGDLTPGATPERQDVEDAGVADTETGISAECGIPQLRVNGHKITNGDGCSDVKIETNQSPVETELLMNPDYKNGGITSVKFHKSDNKIKNEKTVERATSCYDNAPDGGWGWVVTFAAFMVGLILDGISFSFGLFFKELLAHFNESKSLTSWIISVLNGTYLGIGKPQFHTHW